LIYSISLKRSPEQTMMMIMYHHHCIMRRRRTSQASTFSIKAVHLENQLMAVKTSNHRVVSGI
jgi:hypothetical protein